MRSFMNLEGQVAPLDRNNVDTDAIIAKQFMKSVHKTGYGENLFDQWRYLDQGEPGMDNSQRPKNLEFVLNQTPYASANVLLTRENFGCGSSREHAPWALWDFGIRALIASSFADIFYGNCFKNGMLPIVLPADEVDALFERTRGGRALRLRIDLPSESITLDDGSIHRFGIDPERKRRLLNGLDDISITLEKTPLIAAYEARRRQAEPWTF